MALEEVARDIDAIVRQVRFTGWTSSDRGDREIRKALKRTLHNFGLPTTGMLFEHTYGYIREHY